MVRRAECLRRSADARACSIGEDKVADYLVSVTQGGLDAGAVLGTWGQLRGGYCNLTRPCTRRHRFAGAAVDPGHHGRTARGDFHRSDRPCVVPPVGIRAGGNRLLGNGIAGFGRRATTASKQAVASIKSWGPHTLNAAASGGSSLGSDMPAYEQFTLGGALHLSAYRLNEFAGRQFAFGRLMYYNRTLPLPDLLGSGVYVGGSAEIGRISDRTDGLPTPGTRLVGLGVCRCRHLPRSAVRRRRRRRWALEPVPAAGRAVVGRASRLHQPPRGRQECSVGCRRRTCPRLHSALPYAR